MKLGGFIPNKNPWVLPLEFQWGKSLGSPFNNPSCGRANGSLGVPEMAGVWLVLRGPAFDWKMFFFKCLSVKFFFEIFATVPNCLLWKSNSIGLVSKRNLYIFSLHPFCTSSIKGFHQKFSCKGELWLPKLQLLRCGAFFRREEWVSSCYDG